LLSSQPKVLTQATSQNQKQVFLGFHLSSAHYSSNHSGLTERQPICVQVLNVMKMGGNTLVELSVDSNLLDPNGFPYVAGLAGEGLLVQLLSPVSLCFAGLAGEGLLVKLLSPISVFCHVSIPHFVHLCTCCWLSAELCQVSTYFPSIVLYA